MSNVKALHTHPSMALQRNERIYLQVVQSFLQGQLPVDAFVREFMNQWRQDRDADWKLLEGASTSALQANEFSAALAQAFTACDCYSHEPNNEFEISETQLRLELQGLFGAALGMAHAL